jgi:hypothetical protein
MGDHLMSATLPSTIVRALPVRTLAVATMTFTLAVGVSAQAPSPPGSAVVALAVGGGVTRAMFITPADLKAMPRTTVTVSEEGREVKYDGVLVGEVLKRAGAPVGRDLSGPAVASPMPGICRRDFRSPACRPAIR